MSWEKYFSFNASLRSFIKNGGTYMFFSVVNRAIPFVLLPVLTKYLRPDEFGVIAVFTVIMSVATPIIGLCSNSVLWQKYFKLNNEERVYFINDSYKIMAGMFVIVTLIAVTAYPWIEAWIRIPLFWVEVALVCGLMSMSATLTSTIFQLRKQAVKFGVLQSSSVVTNLLLSILFVVYFKLSWQGRLLAILLSSFIIFVYAVHVNYKNNDISLQKMRRSPQLFTIMSLGGALIPTTVSGWALSMSDRIFLTRLTSLDAVGIYSIGIMIGQIVDVILNSFHQSYQPVFFEAVSQNTFEKRIRIVQVIYLFIIFSLLVALIISLLSPLILRVMVDKRYAEAQSIVAWIAFSNAFWSIGALFYNLILSAEKNGVASLVSYATIIINLAANYLFITAYGMRGAAIGSMVSSASFMLLFAFASLRYHRMPWLDTKVLKWSL
ncbi:MAG: oligosaccharide flippase family protein [Nitrospirota bacterium]